MTNYFSIPVLLPETDVLTFLSISHTGETFSMVVFGEDVSMIKNRDGSWRQINGNASQEVINVIGQAIEEYHRDKV